MVEKNKKYSYARTEIFRILFFVLAFFFLAFSFANSAEASYMAEYWNITAQTSPVFPTGTANYTTTTNDINFNWGESSPAPGTINVNGFVGRWTETKYFNAGSYYFSATVDDGIRIYVDGSLILNSWIDQGAVYYSRSYDISAGTHTIKVEYYENSGGAVCQFSYYNQNPSVSSLTPSDNAASISPNTNLVINFSQTVYTSPSVSNDIVIKKASDNSTIETIDVKDAKVSGSGTSTITINPSVTLADNTAYYIQIGANAFYNGSSYYYPGISDTATWNFTTGDFTNPLVSNLSPADDAVGVGLTANLIINFDEAVAVGSGNITIYKSSDDSVFEEIDVTSGKVTGSGTSAITVNPAGTLTGESGYYVKIDANAFDDLSGNSYAGIDNSTSWNFTSVDITAPTITDVAAAPSADSTVITWTTNEAASSQVQYGLASSTLGSSTSESDTDTRVTSHTVNLSSLHKCARYFYQVKAKDAGNNLAVSDTSSFVTGGCDKSTIDSGDEQFLSSSGGSVTTNTDNGTATLTVPENFSVISGEPQSANFQINKLDVSGATDAPAGKNIYQDNFFDLLAAKNDGTSITSFDQDITFTINYGSDTEARFVENTLDVYKYSGGTWIKKNCVLDMEANTLTCTLRSFSVYGVLGETIGTEEDKSGQSADAKIISWKATGSISDSVCPRKIKLELKGKHFEQGAEVKIGSKKALSVNWKSSKEIEAKFCWKELLKDKTNHKKTVSVINPGARAEKADKKIDLKKIIFEKTELNKPMMDYDQESEEGTRQIQTALNNLGYLDAQYITGTFGEITTEAVKKFQSDNNIEPTGFVGPLTQAKLEEKTK